MSMINSYDMDGVIYMGEDLVGLRPSYHDIIITGRSDQDEREYTERWLRLRGIMNPVIMNPVRYADKTRESSAKHKANIINTYWNMLQKVVFHYEDDSIQAKIIEELCPQVKVIRIVHDLVEKENVWHGPIDNTGSPKFNV